MAELFLAQRSGPGGFRRLVAVKRILPHLSEDHAFADMFLNEGRIAAQLDHPNICQVFDLGEDRGGLYLAMEYLEGVSMHTFCANLQRDDEQQYLRLLAAILYQVAAGLEHAHQFRDPISQRASPVVHRDVSPQNIFLTSAGVCKVLDFGVAKVLTEGNRTQSGVVKGKLAYMAPEQAKAGVIDARTDVFSTAVVFWEAITGRGLFQRSTDFLVWQAMHESAIPLPSVVRPQLPKALDSVLLNALAREPGERTVDIMTFANEFCDAIAAVGAAADARELVDAIRSNCSAELAAGAATVAAAHRSFADAQQQAASANSRARRQFQSAPTVIDGDGDYQPAKGDGIATDDQDSAREVYSAVSPSRPSLRILYIGCAVALLILIPVLVVVWSGATPSTINVVASMDATNALVAPIDAATADREIEVIDAPPVAARDAPAKPKSLERSVKPVRGTGYLTIDAKPYATIFVDGKRLGDTPLFRQPVDAGSHVLRAVRADKTVKNVRINVRKGEVTEYGSIRW
jgi:eukaryotic-like serine/threonine-protein kinase